MTSLADRSIAALRANHDELAARVRGLSDEQLAGPSGATEWTVAQVLSHLGSGAEITLASYRAALDETSPPDQDFNPGVWDRWNAMSPQQQAAGYLEHDAVLVDLLEALTSDQRETLQVKVGFLPDPLPLAAVAGMRLNESAQHSWDVRVALDSTSTLTDGEAAVLAEQFAGQLGFLLGFIGKADAVTEPVVVEIGDSGFQIAVADGVRLTEAGSSSTAQLAGPLEAAIRLIGGRLSPEHTPREVEVSGNVTLDDLRRVFPGF